MRHLEQLPAFGFTVACFPCKIARGSAGWTRAVALFD
jgi:kynurenine formamidase